MTILFLGKNYYQFQYNKTIIYEDKSKEELIDYFNEIALGSEFGGKEKVVKKWETPVKR